MQNKLLTLAALLLAAVAFPAHATNGMRMIGFGPVQNSMGGVGVGATLDSASILTNPAGMPDLGGRVDFGATWFSPTVRYSAEGNPAGTMPGSYNLFVNQPGVELKSDRGASPVPAFGLVIPIDAQWYFGIGAYGVAGMGVDYAQNLYSSTTFTSYSQMRFTPGVAYKLNDMFQFGVTVNAMYATTEWNAASNFGQATHDTAAAFGIGATIGAKVTPIPMLTIGAAFETRSFFQDFAYNTAARTASGNALPGGVDKLTFNQPCVLTGGVSVKPIDMLLIAADVEWINWSVTNGSGLPSFSQNASMAMPWNMNWSNQVVVKIGAQVAPLEWLKVRAGWNYARNPLDANRAFENIAFPALAENHVTAGVGFDIGKKVVVNVGGMYAPKVTVTGANAALPYGFDPTNPGPYGQGIQAYSTSMSQYSLDAGVGVKF